MDFWIPLLGGALGAALINGGIAIFKLTRDKDIEHGQWLRNQKQVAYVEFLDWCRDLENFAKGAWRKEPVERIQEFNGIMHDVKVTPVRLLAPSYVKEASDQLLDSVVKLGRLAATEGPRPSTEEFLTNFEAYSNARGAVGLAYRKDLRLPE